MATELGHDADLLEGADAGTPLQLRLDALVKRLALAAGAIVRSSSWIRRCTS